MTGREGKVRRKLFSFAAAISLALCLVVAWTVWHSRSVGGVLRSIAEVPVGGHMLQLSEIRM
jgi:hypothetical protein